LATYLIDDNYPDFVQLVFLQQPVEQVVGLENK
jgi:hypothetical protein